MAVSTAPCTGLAAHDSLLPVVFGGDRGSLGLLIDSYEAAPTGPPQLSRSRLRPHKTLNIVELPYAASGTSLLSRNFPSLISSAELRSCSCAFPRNHQRFGRSAPGVHSQQPAAAPPFHSPRNSPTLLCSDKLKRWPDGFFTSSNLLVINWASQGSLPSCRDIQKKSPSVDSQG